MLKANISLKLLPYWSVGHWHTQDNNHKGFSKLKSGWSPIAKLSFFSTLWNFWLVREHVASTINELIQDEDSLNLHWFIYQEKLYDDGRLCLIALLSFIILDLHLCRTYL